MSGTPLQNRVSELFSLIRFLRVRPYAHYYCKNCPCRSLDYRVDPTGKQCLVSTRCAPLSGIGARPGMLAARW